MRGLARGLARGWATGSVARLLLVVAITAMATRPAAAQRYTVELRGGAAIGNYTETGAGLDIAPGPSFAATAELRFTELVSAYAGINRSSFGCEEGLCTGGDVTLVSQGATAGVRLTRGRLWGRVGAAVQVLRQESDVRTVTSDPGIGWDLAAGVEVPVGRGFLVRPGLTWLRHQTPDDTIDGHASVLALEVSVAMRF